MEILVFGAGSLGSLVGGLLASTHDVTLVGRNPHVEAIREFGLQIGGEYDRRVTPDATTALPTDCRADCAVATVKAFDTASAAHDLAECDLGAVLSLQNGLGNEERLAEALEAPVLAGTCTYGARRPDPGVVECTGVGEVVLGSRTGGESAVAHRVGDAFTAAGLETTVASDMPRRLWEKLAVNAGINAPTALAAVENGELVDGPAADLARRAAAEVARVALDEGVDLDPERAREAVADVARTTASNTSSMRQDLEAGRRTEVDAIYGAVCDRASEPVPVTRTLADLVRAWEAGQGLR